jgi:D-alanyl-lipoteichoic acid acyltransferase DltB (MBOAT superfamily)
MLVIRIPENFNFPYISRSFKDFWKRWHISLSSWIRDYLYLPLAGIQVVKTTGEGGIGEGLESTQRINRTKALFLTWVIMGFWHGANWTFVLWGFMHACFVYLERKLKPLRLELNVLNSSIVGWIFTTCFVMLSWIPFRADSISTTFIMLGKIFRPTLYFSLGMRENIYIVTFLLILIFLVNYFIAEYLKSFWIRFPIFIFWFEIIKFSIIFILVFTFLRPISQFIYFQF